MAAQTDDDNEGIALGIVFGIVALVVVSVLGASVYKSRHHAADKAPVAAVAAPAAMDTSAAAADGASIKVENGVVKFYFASGKADVAAGAKEALADAVAAVAAGKTLSISGFHDASGDPAKNAELAKVRAFAVRDAITALGVAPEKIELKKPEDATASGPASEARRVEVSIQ
jgi:outer membrane protein OmpA-like peptidoglycan-associated protein